MPPRIGAATKLFFLWVRLAVAVNNRLDPLRLNLRLLAIYKSPQNKLVPKMLPTKAARPSKKAVHHLFILSPLLKKVTSNFIAKSIPPNSTLIKERTTITLKKF